MYENKVDPNVVSLTDTALTLIVVFLATLPAMFWSGINIDTAKTSDSYGRASDADEREIPLIVSVSKNLLYVNGKAAALSRLEKILRKELAAGGKQREVVIAPDEDVALKRLVKVFDAARGASARKLILLESSRPQ